jgi:hypothetical protein
MPNKADSKNIVMLEMHHVRCFHTSTTVFDAIMRMKIVRKQLLNKLQRNTRRYQKIRKPKRITRPSVNKRIARKLTAGLRVHFTQEGNKGNPTRELKNLR